MSNNNRLPHRFEEPANFISHALAAVLSVIGAGLMWQQVRAHEDILVQIAVLLFGGSLILLYGCSAAYHGSLNAKTKAFWRKLDHAAIYLLIAGTYSPFTLISLRHSWAFYLAVVIWSIAIAGVILEFAAHLKFKKLSLTLYLLMGWMVLVAVNPMLQWVPAGGLWWLLAGGLCYSFGVIFYVKRQWPFHHLLWHLCVLAGSLCHFIAIYQYILPKTVN